MSARKAAPPRTILVPLDGSALGESVLDYVRWIADPRRTTLILLQVVPSVKPTGLVRGREAAAYRSLAEQEVRAGRYLDRIRARCGRHGIRAEVLVRAGDPAEEIVDCARTREADLIAMSTHGRSGLRRVLLGSVAEGVLRRSALPILLIRRTARATSTRRP
jgi:nucleotide-binding universal stress UspA family protein